MGRDITTKAAEKTNSNTAFEKRCSIAKAEWDLTGTIRSSTYRGRQVFGIADPRALHDVVNTVGGHVLERFDCTVGPANLDGFHLFRRAQAKVKAQIVLREITSSAADFIELFDARRANRHARADRRPIALGADELEEHAMKAAGIHVFQKRRRLANI